MKIKGLDYIRFLGIFLVLAYHLFAKALPGGFLGVNILFVLSGFLISFHLIDSFNKDGKIDLKSFYYKRFVRIFPAILLMLSLVTVFALFINKDYTVGYFDQFLSAFTYNYNFFEILRGGSYEGEFIKQLFMHTWSLAIEVHFYILWPIILLAMYKSISNKRQIKRRFSKKLIETSMILYAYAYVMIVLLVLINKESISFLYFFDLSRMGSFVFGAMLASFVKRFSFNRLPYNKLTGICSGLLLLMSLVFSYNNSLTYIFGFLLTDLITGLMILVAYSNKTIEEGALIKRLSEYSYGMYVFHWPAFVIALSFIEGIGGLLIAILVTVILVLFNYHIFEPIFKGEDIKPILYSKPARKFNYKDYQGLIQFALVFMIISSFALSYSVSEGSDIMFSLEKKIKAESINQDIDKIYLDKKLVDDLNKKEKNDLSKLKDQTTISLIGDSVLLGNRQMLQEKIPNLVVDAEGSRPLEAAAGIIEQMQDQDNLGSIVAIGLGTNAVDDPTASLEALVKSLPEGKRLILISAYDNRFDQPHRVSVAMAKISKKYDFITLMPWEEEAIAHEEYYEGTDGVHFYGNMDAYDAYLKLLKKAINESLQKPAKGE